MVFLNNGFLIFGGYNDYNILSTIARFSLQSRQWSFVGRLVEARRNHGVLFFKESVLVIGGNSGTKLCPEPSYSDPPLFILPKSRFLTKRDMILAVTL